MSPSQSSQEPLHSDAQLARRLEDAELWGGKRFAVAIQKLEPSTRAESLAMAGGNAMYMGAGHPLTQALGVGLDRPVTPTEFNELEDFFFSRRAAAQIVVCPFTDASMMELMGERGYSLHHFENVLYRPLAPGERFNIQTDGFLLERNKPEYFETAAWIQAQCFFREEAADYLPLAWASFMIEDSLSYIAWVGQDVVAVTGGILLRDLKLASFFGTSTLAPYRGRGIQTAMLQARMADAVAAGCDLAFVGAMPGSTTQRNAERLGFRVAYSKTVMVRPCPAKYSK